MSNQKVGKRIIDNGGNKLSLTPLEDAFAPFTMLQINLQGRSIGAYLLRKGVDNFLIQFGFECGGIHSTLRSEQIDPVFDAIESGLKDLPDGERLTIHLSSFTNDTSRQQQLQNLSDIAPNKELQYLLMGERCRTQQLTTQGVRKPKNLRLYCTYTIETNSTGTSDVIEKILSKLERSWKSFTGEINELQFIAIERLLHSAFTDYTQFMGDDGAYFDIGKESSNLFELPNLRSLPSYLQQERFEDYKDFLANAILAMVSGNRRGSGVESQVLMDTVRSLIALALKAFFGDELIRDRYAAAYTNGFGSDEWQTMPTLHDFLGFCSHERLRLDSLTGDTKAALETIRLRLRFWLSSRVGQALAQPSTFRSDARLLIFALRNLSNDEDAAILSLSAYSAALRRALAAPASIFFIDESPILFEFDAIASLVGRLCANGAKAGIRVILSAQDPDTIAKSPSGSKIFQNLSTRLIGRIQPTAIDSFANILKYPQEIISRNATESFFPKKECFYSQWLLDDNGIFTFSRYYPAFNLLAVVVNNPKEQEQRTLVLSKYPDKFVAITAFSKQLIEAEGRR